LLRYARPEPYSIWMIQTWRPEFRADQYATRNRPEGWWTPPSSFLFGNGDGRGGQNRVPVTKVIERIEKHLLLRGMFNGRYYWSGEWAFDRQDKALEAYDLLRQHLPDPLRVIRVDRLEVETEIVCRPGLITDWPKREEE
jgi:hypothetical protein